MNVSVRFLCNYTKLNCSHCIETTCRKHSFEPTNVRFSVCIEYIPIDSYKSHQNIEMQKQISHHHFHIHDEVVFNRLLLLLFIVRFILIAFTKTLLKCNIHLSTGNFSCLLSFSRCYRSLTKTRQYFKREMLHMGRC